MIIRHKNDPTTIRGAAKIAAKQLKAFKIKNCEFCFTDSALIGHFENSFMQWNYEICSKRPKKDYGEDVDPRTLRVETNIEKYTINVADKSYENNEEYKLQLAAARAMKISRMLAETRGSIADPEYMEAQARKIAGQHPSIEHI